MELSFGRRRKSWELAYVLAVFVRYGLIKQGARGLVIGEVNQPLTQYLVSEGMIMRVV